MSEDKDHGYGWDDLRERPARDLAVGDTFVSPAAFSAYGVDGTTGRVFCMFGWEGPRGTAWTVTARDGGLVTARSHDGIEVTQELSERARVLVVAPPEPVGTVLVVKSHRASERLERALGRKPAMYYDRAMKRGGTFVVLYGDDVATALGITSIGRTRLKPGDVALCMGSTVTVDDNGLRVTGEDSQPARREADIAVGRRAQEAGRAA
ncbi:hypothetical protein ABTY20_18910 [Streptomyces sp. NPDC126497]|uniref:hypothetical protein n=1 Tax=Streptomyces sp. NPDC126497 TaxID=3155313 RepID=UPI00331880D2